MCYNRLMETNEQEKTCCFTGHRPEKLPWGYDESDPDCVWVKSVIADTLDALYARGVRHFICGMAVGADLYFAEAVLTLRERRPDVTLEAAIPFAGQSRWWSEEQKQRYERLLAACDTQTVLRESYTRWCMHERNRYMVDRSAYLLALYNGTSGGTRYTVDYAKRRGLRIVDFWLP